MNFPLGKRLRNNFLEIPLEYSTHYLKWGHYGTYWTSIHLNFYKEPPENILLDNKQGQRLYSKAWVMLKCLINHSFYCRKLVEIKKIRRPTKMHISGICQRLWPISWWMFEPVLRGMLNNHPQHKPPGPSSSPQVSKSLESHPNLLLSWSLKRLGSLQLTTGRNPRLSCTGALWLLSPTNSSLGSLAKEEPGIQSCSY